MPFLIGVIPLINTMNPEMQMKNQQMNIQILIFSILFAATNQTKSVLVMSLDKKKVWNKKTEKQLLNGL
jgi:hypothetical protein